MTAINILVSVGFVIWALTVLFSPEGAIEKDLTRDPSVEIFIRSFFPSVEAFWFLFVIACWPMLIVEMLRQNYPAWFPRPPDEDSED